MSHKTLPIKEALDKGWDATKKYLFFFIGAYALVILVSALPSLYDILTPDKDVTSSITFILLLIVGYLAQILMNMGLTKIAITITDDKRPSIKMLFSEYRKILNYIATAILVAFISFLGFLLLIIPGFIWAVKYQFAVYLVIDKNINVFEAIHRSGQMTKGVKLKLFLFSILLFFLNLLGMLLFFVGVLVTMLISIVATAYLYRYLESNTEYKSEYAVPTQETPALSGDSSPVTPKVPVN